jgi:Immunity protein Imm1
MRKRTYFHKFKGWGWPSPNELEHYFLSASGRRQAFDTTGNDCWGLSAEGIDGTEHLPAIDGRIDIRLTILGNLDHGVLLHYDKPAVEGSGLYYSKGDLKRLWEWTRTNHGDLMPVGLFIPFESAWSAVKEFIETDGALPQSIGWIADHDIPPDAFPDPATPPARK